MIVKSIKNETKGFVCRSDDLPGWVWVLIQGSYQLIPASQAEEEGLI